MPKGYTYQLRVRGIHTTWGKTQRRILQTKERSKQLEDESITKAIEQKALPKMSEKSKPESSDCEYSFILSDHFCISAAFAVSEETEEMGGGTGLEVPLHGRSFYLDSTKIGLIRKPTMGRPQRWSEFVLAKATILYASWK